MKVTITEEQTAKIRTLLNHLIGNVSARRLFTGYGLFYKNESMFGLFQNQKFYLKAEDDLALTVQKLGGVSFHSMDPKPKTPISHYYCLPDHVMQDNELFRKLLILSITQIREKKVSEDLRKKNRIKELANLSIKHERLLKKVGVETVEQFRQMGAISAIIELKKIGILAGLEMYWNFICALKNRNAVSLTEQEKQIALKKLNKALFEAGLRRYKED